MAYIRGGRVRRIVTDVVFYGATIVLAWWAFDHDPWWAMTLWVAGALVVAVIARRLLVRIRTRHAPGDSRQ
jgi:membrane protein implicated in regulation of membrane protease activity